MNSKNRIVKISSICLIFVASAITVFVVSSKDDGNKSEAKKQANISQEQSVLSVESMLSGSDDTIDATISEIELKAKQEKSKKDAANKEAELKEAAKKYPNWVKGLDFRDYIDYDKLKDYGIVKIKSGNVNIRSDADEKSKVVGIITNNSAGKILDKKKDSSGKLWYKIQSGEVTGYILAEYMVVGDEAKELIPFAGRLVVFADCDVLNVRSDKSTNSKKLDSMAKNEKISVLEVCGDWIKVDFEGNENAYVAKQYTRMQFVLDTASKSDDDGNGAGNGGDGSDLAVSGGSATGRSVVAEAKKYVGNRYVWGGTSLTNGIDCSGFTMRIYEKFGVKLPHNAAAQSSKGKAIPVSSAQPGDLVFYSSGGRISHVAICAGGGKIVHAASKKSGIKIANMNFRAPAKVIRLIN